MPEETYTKADAIEAIEAAIRFWGEILKAEGYTGRVQMMVAQGNLAIQAMDKELYGPAVKMAEAVSKL